MSIWMAVCPSVMAHTSSHNMQLMNCRRKRPNGVAHRGCLPDERPSNSEQELC
jgi:hypothetical protein